MNNDLLVVVRLSPVEMDGARAFLQKHYRREITLPDGRRLGGWSTEHSNNIAVFDRDVTPIRGHTCVVRYSKVLELADDLQRAGYPFHERVRGSIRPVVHGKNGNWKLKDTRRTA